MSDVSVFQIQHKLVCIVGDCLWRNNVINKFMVGIGTNEDMLRDGPNFGKLVTNVGLLRVRRAPHPNASEICRCAVCCMARSGRSVMLRCQRTGRVCNVLAEVLAAVGSTFSQWRALPSTTESVRSAHQNRVGLGMLRDRPTLALG